MNMQEYQSKQLLIDHGCSVQKFVVVDQSSGTDVLNNFSKLDLIVFIRNEVF